MSNLLPSAEFLAENKSFTSGVQFAWDSTSLGAAKRCPRYYNFTIRHGLRRKAEALPLTFGILFHKGREIYDKAIAAGVEHTQAQISLVRYILLATWNPAEGKPTLPSKAQDEISGDNNRNRETLVRALVWHTENYHTDACQMVILSNNLPAVELSFRFSLDGAETLLCGHLDKVVDYAGTKWVQDYKTTTTTLGSYFFEKFTPDNQMSLYSLAARVVFDTPAQGVIIDGIQSAVGFTAFGRGFAPRTEEFLEEWLLDTKEFISRFQDHSQRESFPANDSACAIYGGCTFRSICSKSPSVRSAFLSTDFEQKTWDPMIPR